MVQRRLTRWVSALMLAGCLAVTGQALAQSSPVGPANPSVVLISQPSNSQMPPSNVDASRLSAIISQGADDFVVPNNLFWRVTAVITLGQDKNPTGTGSGVTSVVVQFYGDSGGGLPGVLLYNATYQSGSFIHLSNGTITVPLSPIPILGPGHYWLSVQPQVSSCPGSDCPRWQWNESPGQQYAESAWQGNWVSSCTTWKARVTVCGRPAPSFGKDLAFELDGVTVPVVGRVLLPILRR